MFTDTGTGEVNSAQIVLRAQDGNYITSSGSATIIKKWDRIRIQVTDLGGNSYDRFFEIINILPTQSKSEGTLLTLDCLGIEYHTQHIHMSKPYWFEDSYTVGLSIGDMYERNRGTEQPILSNYNVVYTEGNGYGNALPWFNANNWEFGLNEDTCYNRWMDLIDGAGAAVSAGGALTFYELSFDTTGVNSMNFKLRKSGDNTTIVTVKNDVSTGVKVGEQEGMEANPTGTHVMAWGSNYHGSLPVENAKYWSGVIKFQLRPNWGSGVVYETDAIVKVDSTSETISPSHYVCIADHTSGASTKPGSGASWATYWSQVDMSDEFGDSVQYSPWTDDKARLWSNAGADPGRTNFTAGGWFDINTVVNDEKFFRTWVDAIASTNAGLDTLAATYSYDGTRDGFPRGFRILVTSSSPTGDLANFANQVVEVVSLNSVGTARTWRKLYNFNQGQSGVHVANLDDGKIYQDTIGGTAASPTHSWAAISSDAYGNDCFHPWTTAPANVEGVDLVPDPDTSGNKARSAVTDSTRRPDITKDGSAFSTNQSSAVRFVAQAVPSGTQSAANDASDMNDPWQKSVVGFNLRFPFPNATDGGISENVGELYGGGASEGDWATSTAYTVGQTVHESNKLYICIVAHTSGTFATDLSNLKWRQLVGFEPSTLDVQNMHYTHDGQDGFNCLNSAVEDFGQISAVSMWLHYSQSSFVGELDDEHKFRAFFIDTRDNVVYQDFVIRFSNTWEEIRLPISGFRPYRGRKPLTAIEAGLSDFKPAKEMEMINIFEWRNIKLFGVQYQSQYDEFGRFNPAAATLNGAGTSVTWANLLNATRTLTMDGFHFVKPLLATSGNVTDRNAEPDFLQFPNIEIYDQLQNAAKSQLEIEKFQHKEFNLDSAGDEIFDIRFGDSFYLLNSDLVSDSDNSTNNNIKLVAKRIEYSITKPPQGRGGLRRKINGSKVFT